MKTFYFSIIASVFFISCNQKISDIYFTENIKNVNPHKVESITLDGDLVLNDMIGIGNFETTNQYLCLFTTPLDTLFHLYSLDGSYLAAFGIKGQGPNDFGSVRANGIKNTEQGQEYLWINDVNAASLKRLNITESIKKNQCIVDSIIRITPMSINAFYSNNHSIIQEIMTPNNFDLVIKKNEEVQKEELYKINTPHPFNTYKNTMRHNSDLNMLISAMVSINQINFLNLRTKERYSICVGEHTNMENIIDKKTNTNKWIYYTDLRITENYIFALFLNQNYQDAYVKEKPIEIQMFTKDGNLLKIIHIKEYLKNICITEDESTIYGLVGDHSIYKYHIIP